MARCVCMKFRQILILSISSIICSFAAAGGGGDDNPFAKKPPISKEQELQIAAKKAAAEAEEQSKKACAARDLALVVGLKATLTNSLVGFDNSLPIWVHQTGNSSSAKSLPLASSFGTNSLLVTVDPRTSAVNQILGVLASEVTTLPDDFTRFVYLKTVFIRNPDWSLRVGPGPGILSVERFGDLEKRARDFRGGLFKLSSYQKEIEKAWNFEPNAYGWPARIMSFDVTKWTHTLNVFPNQMTNINLVLAVENVWERAINKVYNGNSVSLNELEDICLAVLTNFKLQNKISVEEFLKLPPMTDLVKASFYADVRRKTQAYIDFWRAFKQRTDALYKAGMAGLTEKELVAIEQEYTNLALSRAWEQIDGPISKFFKESPYRREVRDQVLKDLFAKDRRADWLAFRIYNQLLIANKVGEINAGSSVHEVVIQYLQKNFGAVGEVTPEKTLEFDILFDASFFRELDKAKSQNYSSHPLSSQVHSSQLRLPKDKGYYSATDLPVGLFARDGVPREKEVSVYKNPEETEIPDFVTAAGNFFSTRIKKFNSELIVSRSTESQISDYVRFRSILNLAQYLRSNLGLNSSDFLQAMLSGNIDGFRHFEVHGHGLQEFSNWSDFEGFLARKADETLAAIHVKFPSLSRPDLESLFSFSEVQLREFRSLTFNNESFPKIPDVQSARRFLLEYLYRNSPIDENDLRNFAKSLGLESQGSSVEVRQSVTLWIQEARVEEFQNRVKFFAYREFMLGSL